MMMLENVLIARHEPVGPLYRRLEFDAPALAAQAQPGQFIHLKVPNLRGAVLRRPFSICGADDGRVAILYKRVGLGTQAMADLQPGMRVSLIGPLGNVFPAPPPEHVPVAVAGGYGVAPLSFMARRLHRPGLALIGASRADDILCVADFEQVGWEVRIATMDGSIGRTGLVTLLLDEWTAQAAPRGLRWEAFACGPDGMLKAVGERAVAGDWRAWLSLDKHMGCGVGACLACVQRVRRGDGEAWARVCRDGPIFEAREIVWA